MNAIRPSPRHGPVSPLAISGPSPKESALTNARGAAAIFTSAVVWQVATPHPSDAQKSLMVWMDDECLGNHVDGPEAWLYPVQPPR